MEQVAVTQQRLRSSGYVYCECCRCKLLRLCLRQGCGRAAAAGLWQGCGRLLRLSYGSCYCYYGLAAAGLWAAAQERRRRRHDRCGRRHDGRHLPGIRRGNGSSSGLELGLGLGW